MLTALRSHPAPPLLQRPSCPAPLQACVNSNGSVAVLMAFSSNYPGNEGIIAENSETILIYPGACGGGGREVQGLGFEVWGLGFRG